MDTDQPIRTFIRRHPVSTYYVLAIAISWAAILGVVGPVEFFRLSGTGDLFPIAGLASLLGPSLAGLGLTALIDGRPGMCGLMSRLRRWNVGIGWYVAFADRGRFAGRRPQPTLHPGPA